MANSDPSRTEKPTGKRIQKARDEGNVLTCQDIGSVVILATGFLLMLLALPRTCDAFRDILFAISRSDCREAWHDNDICQGGLAGVIMLMKIMAPALFGIAVAAIVVMRAQVGSYFSFQCIKWKFDGLFNPKAIMNEMLPSKQSMARLFISSCKVLIVGWLIYLSIKSEFDQYLNLEMMPLWSGVMWVANETIILVFKIIALLIAVAAVNYWFQHKQYYDNLMMTKQEVKDERKNQDGDPAIKAKIRSRMRQILIQTIKGHMKNADVVVTNPTHVAIALKYNPEKDAAPVVIAKGLRKRAEHIKAMAFLYGVPIVEAPPLARSLYRNVKVGQSIPPEFYKAVAAILAKLSKTAWRKRKSKTLEKAA